MKLDDLLDLAVAPTAPDRLWDGATRWLASRGFDKVLHLTIAQGAANARTTLGQDFEGHYHDCGMARHDPFGTYCLQSDRRVATGIDYVGDYKYLTDPEKQVILSAGEAGFRAGFSLVVRREATGCEAWNIGSSLPRTEVEKIAAEEGSTIRMAMMAIRGRLGGPARLALSARERQCMDLLATGLRTKSVAQELGLAEVTVELHLRNARRKLGATTRDQALMLYQMTAVGVLNS